MRTDWQKAGHRSYGDGRRGVMWYLPVRDGCMVATIGLTKDKVLSNFRKDGVVNETVKDTHSVGSC